MIIRETQVGMVPLGRHRKVLSEDFITASAMPSWLRLVKDSANADINSSGGVTTVTPLGGTGSSFNVGKWDVGASGANANLYGWETVAGFDLTQAWVKRLWITFRNLRTYVPTTSQTTKVELSIASTPDASTGASTSGVKFRVLPSMNKTTGWPEVVPLTSAGEGSPMQVRQAIGHIQGATDPRRSGNARDFTLMIDRDDKTVSILMGDQVTFSRVMNFDYGVLRPRFMVATPSGETGIRSLSGTGIEVGYETNGI